MDDKKPIIGSGWIDKIEDTPYENTAVDKIESILNELTKSKPRNSFIAHVYMSIEQYKTMNNGADELNRAILRHIETPKSKLIDWEVKEWISRNNPPKNIKEEFTRCKKGFGGMSGDEYFFYNFIKINGKSPAPGTWSVEYFNNYKKNVKTIRKIKMRRRKCSYNPILENPISPEEAFYKKI